AVRIDDAIVLQQLLGMLWNAAAREVGRRPADDLWSGGNPLRDELRVGERRDAHRKIVAFLDQIDLLVVQLQVDPYRRIAGDEFREQRREMELSERGG